MTHSFIFGGQPDYLTSLVDNSGNVFGWDTHGREITSGDAEKVLDLAPSVRYRAKSIGSGEFRYFHQDFGQTVTLAHQIGCIIHNLDGVGGKARMVAASSDCFSQVLPNTTLVASSNLDTGLDGSTVAQNPFGAVISTFATPDTQTSDWFIEVGFDNASALQLAVANSQLIYIYLRAKGHHTISDDTQLVTIEVKEDDGGGIPADFPVRVTKTLRIRAAPIGTFNDGDTLVTSVLVDPSVDWLDPTLDDMTVRVTCDGVNGMDGAIYWEVGAIVWQRHVASGVQQDTGWIDAESISVSNLSLTEEMPICSSFPFLDGSGDLTIATGRHVYFMLYWDDSIDDTSAGRPRIFFDPETGVALAKSGTVRTWRPEVGLIALGPGYGTDKLQFNPTAAWTDPSIVRMSKGGNDWTIRRDGRRRLSVSLSHVSAADYATYFAATRRAGSSRPFIVAFKPSPAFSNAVSAAVSLYGKIISFDSSNPNVTTAAPADGEWTVNMTFEEIT